MVHDYDGVGHGKRLFLIMSYINKGNAQFVFQTNQLVLHVLAEFQIQSAQGLVQKQNPWLVDDGAGNGNSLLLSAA